MSGVIGLTAAGQLLDKHLSANKFTYTARIYKFVVKFTKKVNRIRETLLALAYKDDNQNNNDKEYILTLIRKDYIHTLDNELSPVIDGTSCTLIKNYIHGLTHIKFVPSTRTQISIMNKHDGIKYKSPNVA